MIRGDFVKRSVLQRVTAVITPAHRFHLSSRTLGRSALQKIRSNLAEEKHIETSSDHIPSNKCNVNFLGIESEKGVITLNSTGNSIQQNLLKRKLKEKFYTSSFGIIRYDHDNKLKFHGQYGKKKDFVFPHASNEYSEVSEDLVNATAGSSKSFNIFDSDKSSNFVRRSEIPEANEHTHRKRDVLYSGISGPLDIPDTSKDNSELSRDLAKTRASISQTSNSFEVKKLDNFVRSHEMSEDQHTQSNVNVLSKENSDLQGLEKDSPGNSYIDQCYFNDSYTEKIEHSLENSSDIQLSSEELNFIDENYFGGFRVSEIKKFSQKHEGYINKHFSKNLESDYIGSKELSSTQDGEVSIKYKTDNIFEDTFYNQTIDMYNKKHMNISNSSKNTYIKQFNTESNDIDMKSDAGSVSASDEYLYNKIHPQPKNSTKHKIKSNMSSSEKIISDNYPSRTMEFFDNMKGPKHSKFGVKESVNIADQMTAIDFVKSLQDKGKVPEHDTKKESMIKDIMVDSKGFRILKNQVDDLSNFTKDEIISLLKQNILYSDDNLLILNKPYSLVMHESQTTKSPCLSAFLDELAKALSQQGDDPKLYTVHRLDKETTGCLLLARNEMMSQNLKSLFAQRKIIKKYWVLTSGVPDPPEGIIDIPISEGSIDNKKRMVLHPEIPKDIPYRNHSKRGRQAVTSYNVISNSGNAALVEATPLTGIKHQIRVHFGFGICCPILGDHKYSHLDKLAPQKLPSDILQKLHVRQSKVRYIPLHIHSKSVTIPGYFEGRDLFVKAPLPNHMKENLKRLKFRK